MRAQPLKGWQQFAPKPCRFFVHHQQVRLIAFDRGLNQTGAQRCRVFDARAERLADIAAIGQFGHAGQAYVINTFGKGETPGHRGTCQNDRRGAWITLRQRGRQGARAAQMAQPKSVVAVKHDPARRQVFTVMLGRLLVRAFIHLNCL